MYFLNGKKIASAFFFFVWIGGMPAHAMEQAPNVLHDIFINLDKKQLGETALVCKQWFNIIANKLFWNDLRLANKYCRGYFAKHSESVDPSSMFNVPASLRKNLVLAINTNAEELEQDLLNDLDERSGQWHTDISDAKAVASFFIAFHVVNISLVENAIQRLLLKIWWSEESPQDEEGENLKLEMLPLMKAHKACATLCQDPALLETYEIADKVFGEERNKRAWELAKKVYQVSLDAKDQNGDDVWSKLVLLISLSESSQKYFLNDGFFIKVYDAAYQNLIDRNFSLNVEQAKAMIGGHIWENKELMENSYIAVLKKCLRL